MITLQKINQLIGDFATQHLQISSYFFGDFTKNRQSGVSYPILMANPSLVATSTNSTTYSVYIWVLDRFEMGFLNEADVYNDTALILQDLKAYFQNNDVIELILDDEVTFEKVSDEINSDLVGGWVGIFKIRVPFNDDLCLIPGIGSGIAYQDSYRVVSVGAGSSGTSGTSGISGSSGTSGIAGPPGVSNALFYYQAKTTSTTGDPGSGHISWNNANQSGATQLQINHFTDLNVTDIDIFLSILSIGAKLTIQDRNNSANVQVWTVSGTPTKVGTTYWNIPVTLVSSTYSFSNNHDLILATVAPSGTSGTSGSSGTSGITGVDGANALRFRLKSFTGSTSSDPGVGYITTASSNFSSLGTIAISTVEVNGGNAIAWLGVLDDYLVKNTYLKITDVLNSNNFGLYSISNIVSNIGFKTYTLNLIISNGSCNNVNGLYSLSYSVNGANGTGGGGGSFQIPQINARIYKFDDTTKQTPIKVYYTYSDSNEWKSHNPMVWVFKIIPRKRKKYFNLNTQDFQYKTTHQHWGHPSSSNPKYTSTPTNGEGNSIYQGFSLKNTEWDIVSGDTAYQSLINFDFNCLEYYQIGNSACVPGDFPNYLPYIKPRGRARNRNRSVLIFFRIVCQDPNNSDKYLFGPPSPIIKLMPTKTFNTGEWMGIIASEYIYRGQ